MAGLSGNLFSIFLQWLYQSSGGISISSEFHLQCGELAEMLVNDTSGIINTILDYEINSASDATYRVECSEETLQKILNIWISEINLENNGIPTGLQELSKEYFKERLTSSFCILRTTDWETIKVGGVSIEVPKTLYFANGASVYVKRPKGQFKLGSDKYFLDEKMKDTPIPKDTDEEIVVQKPFNRWFDQYPIPYLVKKGILKNWLAMKKLQDKTDDVLLKFLPYLFEIIEGNDELLRQGNMPDDPRMTEIFNNFKTEMEKFKAQPGKTPTVVHPYTEKYSHLMADLRPVLSEELYRQGYRAILAGLGFIDLLEIAVSRQETRMNPKPFISETNAAVNDFKSMLLQLIFKIIKRNKEAHRKFFSTNNTIKVVNSPLRINVEQILADLRSGYDRGVSSIQSYQEILGLDYKTEKERRQRELKVGDEELFYPHLIQNREDIPDRMGIPAKPRKEKDEDNEDQDKKKNTPESDNFKNAEIEYATLIICKTCGSEFIYEDVPEAGMGYIKCPTCQEALTQKDCEEARIDITKNYIRIRQREPGEFEKDSFRIITLSKEKGIKAVIGRLKGKKTTTIQSYLFQKDKWTEEEAKNWVKEHSTAAVEIIESSLIENLEIAPYKSLSELPPAVKKYPAKAQRLWMEVFNSIYKDTGDEARAFSGAWSQLRKYLKRHSKGEQK